MASDRARPIKAGEVPPKSFEKGHRIPTIDAMKGMSMVMILYCHFGWGWRAPDWYVFFRFQWLVLDFFGPIMFLTMSVLGFLASHAGELASGQPVRHTRQELVRISALFLIGEAINFYSIGYLGAYHVTGWNVVTTIAMVSLLMPGILRIKPWARLLLVSCVVLVYYPLANELISALDAAGVAHDSITASLISEDPRTFWYWLLLHHGQMMPIFSWIVVPLVASIIFTPLLGKFQALDKVARHRELDRILLAGVVMIAGGVLTGFQIFPGYGPNMRFEMTTPGDLYFNWPWPDGIPFFLTRHVPQYLFYMLGFVCVIFALLGEVQLVRGQLTGRSKITALGKLSLSAFLLSHVPLMFKDIHLPLPIFFLIFIPLLVAIIHAFGAWVYKFNSKGSMEWAIGHYTRLVQGMIGRIEKMRINREMVSRPPVP